jgi:hypothetical protein
LNSAVDITQPLSVGEKSSGKEGFGFLKGGGVWLGEQEGKREIK